MEADKTAADINANEILGQSVQHTLAEWLLGATVNVQAQARQGERDGLAGQFCRIGTWLVGNTGVCSVACAPDLGALFFPRIVAHVRHVGTYVTATGGPLRDIAVRLSVLASTART